MKCIESFGKINHYACPFGRALAIKTMGELIRKIDVVKNPSPYDEGCLARVHQIRENCCYPIRQQFRNHLIDHS